MNKTNNNLLLGISMGVAIISLAGFFIMTAAYYEKNKELASVLSGKPKNEAAGSTSGKQAVPANADIKVNAGDWIKGDKTAPITIIEFSDFQCPFCARLHTTLEEVIAKNKNVRWVFKQFPLDSHKYGRKSALASECAGEQGKFWEYADGLYANQGSINEEYFGELASGLKLDVLKFNQCLTSEKYAGKVDADQAAGQAAGFSGTPTSFINGQMVEGAVSYETFENIINNLTTATAGSRLQK